MILTQRNPWLEMQSEMNRLHREMDRLFGRSMFNGRRVFETVDFPAVNLWEDDEMLFVEAELPGLSIDDLEIYVNAGTQLTIKGERKEPEYKEGTWHRKERGFGRFAKIVELPSPIDEDNVKASFELGVLTVSLPKNEAARHRRIEVKGD
jgi:HSP20 family protein